MIKSNEEGFEKIIVPIDGSQSSEKAAKKAFLLAKKIGLDVLLLHVIEAPKAPTPTWNTGPEFTEKLTREGQKLLKKIKSIGDEQDILVKTKLLAGIPDVEISNEANENDLIVMGNKGHSAVERILIGSVSEKVLHHSDSSVMIVR